MSSHNGRISLGLRRWLADKARGAHVEIRHLARVPARLWRYVTSERWPRWRRRCLWTTLVLASLDCRGARLCLNVDTWRGSACRFRSPQKIIRLRKVCSLLANPTKKALRRAPSSSKGLLSLARPVGLEPTTLCLEVAEWAIPCSPCISQRAATSALCPLPPMVEIPPQDTLAQHSVSNRVCSRSHGVPMTAK